MAKASEQFRQSDVTTWGIVALVLSAIAVMGANVSALMPRDLLAGLHKTRLEGASLDQLRLQVADLREEQLRLKRETGILTARFSLGEQQGNDITRRVGALEVSLPRLLETLPDGGNIDRNSLTAAIGQDPALVYQAEGGSVVVRHQPMAEAKPAVAGEQPLPAPVQQMAAIPMPNEQQFGIALGPSIPFEAAPEAWRDLSMKLGPLLFGLAPLLVEEANGDDQRIVVGPITQLSEATALCARLERMSVSCLPMPFTGTPLAY
ncbi:hypothetical protein ASD04_02520 [Devosia sp. Root436]|uniref:hypothetical protein n=1 Tax=Devosia sp. Root436 TaxID=1736537 RepID=UPI0007014827|nr:hypothetical protein [Devosia sp. Root436]KQX42852.1 hypothetical protein ASD04_02520 [Devosia sp. Root436]